MKEIDIAKKIDLENPVSSVKFEISYEIPGPFKYQIINSLKIKPRFDFSANIIVLFCLTREFIGIRCIESVVE